MTGATAGVSGSDTSDRIQPFDVLASCALLFVLAVAQPLLDLLGRNAEFFLARNAPTVDIVVLALVLTIVLPLALGVVVILLSRLHPTAGDIAHGLLLGSLGTVLAVQVIRRTPLDALPGALQIGLAAGAGFGLAVAYRRSPAFRSVLRWGALVPIVVLGIFLFASATSELVVGSPADAATGAVEIENPAPVVFMIFDEFPVASLVDGDGAIQEDLYPNFARLARDGTWYRNAVTVHRLTQISVPTILTGINASNRDLPTLRDHPDNLFTLLDDTYDIRATEIVTRLCPDESCLATRDPVPPPMDRWRSLVSDLRVVAGHLFLPEDLTTDLPPIDTTWAGFGAAEPADLGTGAEIESGSDEVNEENLREWIRSAIDQDRQAPIDRFLEGIDTPGDRPPLHFLHAMVPHQPWIRLPTGQFIDLYEPNPAATKSGWVDDPWLVDQVYQLHLLQVQYVDTFVGAVMARLEDLGIYDETLLVVVADHGTTVHPGMSRRGISPDTVGHISAIPLFVKAPHQTTGGIDDYRTETTDIVPTVAGMLGVELPWATDGVSLEGSNRPERTHSVIPSPEGPVELGSDGSEIRTIGAAKTARFGPDGPFGLAPPGHADLLGVAVDTLQVGAPATIPVTLVEPERFDDVDTAAEILPVMVRGHLDESEDGDQVIAVAVNGEIVAVTRTYVDRRDGETRFNAVLPPDSLRDGANELALLLVAGDGAERTLHTLDG